MPATRELLALQSVDGELAVRRARLTEIAPLLGDDSALRALAQRLASEQAEVDSALSRQQELDSVIAGFTERVDAAETRLYSGVVVNPRELQDLQADVNMLKRQRGHEEDALLEVMVELDTARGKRDASAQELESLNVSWAAEQQSLSAEQQRLEAEVTDFEESARGHGCPHPSDRGRALRAGAEEPPAPRRADAQQRMQHVPRRGPDAHGAGGAHLPGPGPVSELRAYLASGVERCER